jgi:hypothetical protein
MELSFHQLPWLAASFTLVAALASSWAKRFIL